MEAASRSSSSPWVTAAVPLVVALAAIGMLVALGRSLPEALGAGAVIGGVAAFLYTRRGLELGTRGAPVNDASCEAAPKRAEKVDVESMARLTTLVADLLPDALMLYMDDGKIVYANTAARDLFFEGNDPCGENFLRILGTAPNALREALLGESDRLFTVEVERQPETYHLSRRAIDLGSEPFTLLVLRNLTREVSRRELATLKNVVRVISHEVNNSLAPIASLVHSARMIADRPEHAQKLRSVFDTIQDRADHLKTFLDGYADLARLPAPRPTAVDWQSFLEHIRALYPGVRFSALPAKTGWFDPVQVEQVLINVIKNALEAGSPEEAVEIGVSVDDDDAIRLEIADRGPGFSDEALASAFTPFYTTKEKGSGMGHSLCREIVQAHGGRMSLSNREGGGALVSLVLPGPAKPDPRLSRSRAKLTLSRV